MMMDHEAIQECLQEALDRAESDDRDLLERDLHEGTITHRIAMYLEAAISPQFPELRLVADVEFNRDVIPGEPEIREGSDGRRNTTDLVVHERGTNKHNLLAIEAKKKKKYNEEEFNEARERLRHLVENPKKRFQLGVLLTYFTGEDFGISSEVVATAADAQPE